MGTLIKVLREKITGQFIIFNYDKPGDIINNRHSTIILPKNKKLQIHGLTYNNDEEFMNLYCSDNKNNEYMINVGLNEGLHFL